MALEAGTRLGSYEVLSSLGAGGMGEVYRARDVKLGREVAIKVLPEGFSADPERMSRFEREAKALASLNHGNIATLYGFESDESEDGPVPFLVMELVEGQTMAERLERGAMPPGEALPLFLQIAEGLEAAHDSGVIHRDLKPANIKITDSGQTAAGRVKILDFGLAKAMAPEEGPTSGGAQSESPTLTLAATQRGEILGTAAYMSPEQARGLAVDARADIWAFGVCLFEALGGERLFAGRDASETLAYVITREPDWQALPGSLPSQVTRLLRRCLVREPNDRLRHIADARLELQEALAAPETDREGAEPPTGRQGSRGPVLAWAAASAIGAAALGAVAATMFLGSDPGPSPQPQKFTLTLPASDRLPPASGDLLAVSDDGRTVSYRADRDGEVQIFRRSLDRFEAEPIGSALRGLRTFGSNPVFSPDGRWIAFFQEGTLMKAAVAGGPPQRLAMWSGRPRGADWTSDGTIVFGGGPLWSVPAAGGEVSPLFTPKDGRQAWYPQILANGAAILFTLSESAPDTGELHILDPASGEHRLLLEAASAGRVLATGHLVFVRGGALWAARFDNRRLDVVGDAIPVVEGVRVEVGGAVQARVSADGRLLAFIPGQVNAGSRTLVWVDRDGEEEALPLPPRGYDTVALSPDGRRAALGVQDGGNSSIWISELERGTLTPLTADESSDWSPLWTLDGRHVVFESNRGGKREIYSRPADASEEARLLVSLDSNPLGLLPAAWTPDGSGLIVTAFWTTTYDDIGIVSIDGTNTYQPLVQSPSSERSATLSPDGHWLAYTSFESSPSEIYVRRFPGLEGRKQVSVGGGFAPSWSADGRELFFVRNVAGTPGVLMRVDVGAEEGSPPSLPLGIPQPLFEGPQLTSAVRGNVQSLAPDGRFLVIARELGEASRQLDEIKVVLNWSAELEEQLPIE